MKEKFSKNVKEFLGRFEHFYTYYRYQQKVMRLEADREAKVGKINESNICNAVSDELAHVVSRFEALKKDFENMVKIGVIKEA